jgi:type IV secretion system protein TrbL
MRHIQYLPVVWKRVKWPLLLLMWGTWLGAHSFALGQTTSVDGITTQFKTAGQNIGTNVLQYAQPLFWSLAAIQFAGSSIRLGLQGVDLQEWAAHIVRQIMFIGVYAWLMTSCYTISNDIIQSMQQVGTGLGGTTGLHAQDMFNSGINLAINLVNLMTIMDPGFSFAVALSGVVLVACFAWLAALLTVALCEGYIMIGAGVLLTGFGGSEWTRDIANKVFMLALSIGTKIFIMEIIMNVEFNLVQQWAASNPTTLAQVFWIMGAAIIFLLIVMELPSFAAQFIAGAASGSTAAQGIHSLTSAAGGAFLGSAGLMMAGQAAAGSLGGSSGLAEGGFGGGSGGELPGGSNAGAAGFGGISGGRAPSPASQAGAAVGQVGRALSRGIAAEFRGRVTGVGIKGGTWGGRVAAYIADPEIGASQSSYPPPADSTNEIS